MRGCNCHDRKHVLRDVRICLDCAVTQILALEKENEDLRIRLAHPDVVALESARSLGDLKRIVAKVEEEVAKFGSRLQR